MQPEAGEKSGNGVFDAERRIFLFVLDDYKDVAHHGGALTEFLHPQVARLLQQRFRTLKA